MLNVKYSEMIEANRRWQAAEGQRPYSVSILSNVVMNPFKDVIEYALRQSGIPAVAAFGEYDNIVQDSGRMANADAVVVFWEMFPFYEKLMSLEDGNNSEEITVFVEDFKKNIDMVLGILKAVPLVLMNSFSALCMNEQSIRGGVPGQVCRELNEHLRANVSGNVVVIDIDKIMATVSVRKCIDWRGWYTSRLLYTLDFYKQYMTFVLPAVCSAAGMAKKALVLDCDNTLWGGTVGEDGLDALQISKESFSGAIFHDVQRMLLALSKKGVLLTICSKNESMDVEAVFRDHPDMVLRPDNIVAKKVDWANKIDNIRLIAQELNISLDSMVFVDDSEFEVNLVRQLLPEVVAFQVPSVLYDYPGMIREVSRLFFNLSVSKEDASRALMYANQAKRVGDQGRFSDMTAHLHSLDLKIKVFRNALNLAPRMAQLTQKTNQFNLTTRRYTQQDISRFLDSPGYELFAVQVMDKYGDYGVTGLMILKVDGSTKQAEVDTFLLSCRVLGRSVEQVFFNVAMDYLNRQGITSLSASYRQTLKNKQVEGLYERLGFSVTESGPKAKSYVIKVSDYKPQIVSYIGVEYGRTDKEDDGHGTGD